MYVRCRLIDQKLQARRGSSRRPYNCKMSKKPRARRYSCKKRTPAAAERSIFIDTSDWADGFLVYGVRLEAAPATDPGTPATVELRPSAEPILRWSEAEHNYSAVAAVSGAGGSGTTILGLIAGSRRTVVHDVGTGTDVPGPRLHRSKFHPVMIPMGADTVLVMDRDLRPGRCSIEALRRVPGGWRAEALPDPPVAFVDEGVACYPYVSAYFAMGSRAWVSVSPQRRDGSTLSLDTERGAWRVEGPWVLPLKGRGIFAPELGVVVGIASVIVFEPSNSSERCCQVCALDVAVAEATRPPAVRRVWEIPPERVEDVAPYETLSLAHLGNGRFCVARSVVVVDRRRCERTGTSFTLVDVSCLPGGELELAKHGKAHCHVWPQGHIGHATFLQHA